MIKIIENKQVTRVLSYILVFMFLIGNPFSNNFVIADSKKVAPMAHVTMRTRGLNSEGELVDTKIARLDGQVELKLTLEDVKALTNGTFKVRYNRDLVENVRIKDETLNGATMTKTYKRFINNQTEMTVTYEVSDRINKLPTIPTNELFTVIFEPKDEETLYLELTDHFDDYINGTATCYLELMNGKDYVPFDYDDDIKLVALTNRDKVFYVSDYFGNYYPEGYMMVYNDSFNAPEDEYYLNVDFVTASHGGYFYNEMEKNDQVDFSHYEIYIDFWYGYQLADFRIEDDAPIYHQKVVDIAEKYSSNPSSVPLSDLERRISVEPSGEAFSVNELLQHPEWFTPVICYINKNEEAIIVENSVRIEEGNTDESVTVIVEGELLADYKYTIYFTKGSYPAEGKIDLLAAYNPIDDVSGDINEANGTLHTKLEVVTGNILYNGVDGFTGGLIFKNRDKNQWYNFDNDALQDGFTDACIVDTFDIEHIFDIQYYWECDMTDVNLPDGNYMVYLYVNNGFANYSVEQETFTMDINQRAYDLNYDDIIDYEDILILSSKYGQDDYFQWQDLNDDGQIDLLDYMLIMKHLD